MISQQDSCKLFHITMYFINSHYTTKPNLNHVRNFQHDSYYNTQHLQTFSTHPKCIAAIAFTRLYEPLEFDERPSYWGWLV